MSFTATVQNGTIKLPPGLELADGTEVRVEPVRRSDSCTDGRTFGERYAKYIGISKEGPEDLAANHDHYLYGSSKREV
jgi:hypothetical protein